MSQVLIDALVQIVIDVVRLIQNKGKVTPEEIHNEIKRLQDRLGILTSNLNQIQKKQIDELRAAQPKKTK